jgi:uncharacterized protein (DUF58 family)
MATETLNKNNHKATSNRLLDPALLMGLSNLELVARTVVDGVLMGLHRSPRFGFSQEFAEYSPYNEGDDVRYIDWNVYSRTGRTYIKRFQGETSAPLMLLMDTSASMGYQSEYAAVSKLAYGKLLAASLAYLASKQMDAVGLIQFDEALRTYRKPSSASSQLHAILHAIDTAQVHGGTVFDLPIQQMMAIGAKRGLVAIISDFYTDTEKLLAAVRPLTIQGQDLILFHVLDQQEIAPKITVSTLYEDAETGSAVEVSPEYMQQHYPQRIAEHIEKINHVAAAMNAHHVLLNSAEPLDKALRHYLQFRQRR